MRADALSREPRAHRGQVHGLDGSPGNCEKTAGTVVREHTTAEYVPSDENKNLLAMDDLTSEINTSGSAELHIPPYCWERQAKRVQLMGQSPSRGSSRRLTHCVYAELVGDFAMHGGSCRSGIQKRPSRRGRRKWLSLSLKQSCQLVRDVNFHLKDGPNICEQRRRHDTYRAGRPIELITDGHEGGRTATQDS